MSTTKTPPGHPLLRNARRNYSPSAFYTPFQDLSRRLMAVAPTQPTQPTQPARPARPAAEPAAVAEPAPPVAGEDEALLFRQAMVDVIPLDRSARARVAQRRTPGTAPRFARCEEMEVYAHLVDLVSGGGSFELCYSDEYVDGAVVGLSPKVLAKLRKGAFSTQDYADLHGLNRVQAHQVVIDFVRRSFAQGYRCVLIVSGRGLNSLHRQPVLKDHLVTWLTHSPLKRLVLAFASARAHDGGVGAFYVLLRRGERKAPFVTPAGLDKHP